MELPPGLRLSIENRPSMKDQKQLIAE